MGSRADNVPGLLLHLIVLADSVDAVSAVSVPGSILPRGVFEAPPSDGDLGRLGACLHPTQRSFWGPSERWGPRPSQCLFSSYPEEFLRPLRAMGTFQERPLQGSARTLVIPSLDLRPIDKGSEIQNFTANRGPSAGWWRCECAILSCLASTRRSVTFGMLFEKLEFWGWPDWIARLVFSESNGVSATSTSMIGSLEGRASLVWVRRVLQRKLCCTKPTNNDTNAVARSEL